MCVIYSTTKLLKDLQQARVKLGFFLFFICFIIDGERIGGKWRKGDRKGEEARIRIAQRPVCNRRRSSKNNECL